MASNLQRPQAIKEPFANSGDKNTIPVADTGTQRASLDEGFPQITEIPVSEGGIPPERKDMNALGYLTTSQYFYLQCGGRFTFDPDVSTAIGGYPAGAVLEYTDTNAGLSYAVISVINNNTYNFVATPSYIDGSKWKKAFSEDLSNYVDLTSNQTIGGIKTFTSNLNIQKSGPSVVLRDTSITKGTAPSSVCNAFYGIIYDSQGNAQANKMSQIYTAYNTNGSHSLNMSVFKPESGSTNSSSIIIGYDPNGNVYTSAPTPATSDNSTRIATTAYVQAQRYALDNAVVKLTGNQSVGGTKTFTNNINIRTAGPRTYLDNTAYTQGTAPSGNVDSGFVWRDSSNSSWIGQIRHRINSSQQAAMSLCAYKQTTGSSAFSILETIFKANGEYYANFTNSGGESGDVNLSLTKSTTSTTDTTIPCMGWVISKIETNLSVNMSNRVSVSESTLTSGYTAPNNGFIYVSGANTSNSAISFLIDNSYVGYNGYQNTPLTQCNTFYLSKGNVFKIGHAFSSSFNAYFVPLG